MADTKKPGPLPEGLDPADYFIVNGRWVDCNGEPAEKSAAKAAGLSEAEQVRAAAAADIRARDLEIATLKAQLAGAPALGEVQTPGDLEDPEADANKASLT